LNLHGFRGDTLLTIQEDAHELWPDSLSAVASVSPKA